MKHNYIDGKGNYHNELNLTLAQIYDSGVEFGCEVTAKGIIEELEKIKAEIMSIGNWREHYEMPIAYLSCLTIVEHHISELKGESNAE